MKKYLKLQNSKINKNPKLQKLMKIRKKKEKIKIMREKKI